jgi:hypothetical protein
MNERENGKFEASANIASPPLAASQLFQNVSVSLGGEGF